MSYCVNSPDLKQRYIEALKQAGNNISKAAKLVGHCHTTFRKYAKQLGVFPSGHRLPYKNGHCASGKHSPEYSPYHGARQRVSNPKATQFKDYGGREIKMCGRWLESFEAFLEDMGPRPSSKHTLDRKDVNGNYEPSNCRWATRKEQSNNMRNTPMLTLDGVTKSWADWAASRSMPGKVLWNRIRRLGWSPREAVYGHYEYKPRP